MLGSFPVKCECGCVQNFEYCTCQHIFRILRSAVASRHVTVSAALNRPLDLHTAANSIKYAFLRAIRENLT